MSLSPFNHVPVPKNQKRAIREKILLRLGGDALKKAESIKGEELTKSEVTAVLEKLRAELTKRGFFHEA